MINLNFYRPNTGLPFHSVSVPLGSHIPQIGELVHLNEWGLFDIEKVTTVFGSIQIINFVVSKH